MLVVHLLAAGAALLAPRALLGASASVPLRASATRQPSRPALAPRMAVDIGDTWFTTFDGKGMDGIAPDGTFPPGDDLIENELRRLFNVDKVEDFASGDIDELQLMFKLRKELGEELYAKIFDDPRVRGADIWD